MRHVKGPPIVYAAVRPAVRSRTKLTGKKAPQPKTGAGKNTTGHRPRYERDPRQRGLRGQGGDPPVQRKGHNNHERQQTTSPSGGGQAEAGPLPPRNREARKHSDVVNLLNAETLAFFKVKITLISLVTRGRLWYDNCTTQDVVGKREDPVMWQSRGPGRSSNGSQRRWHFSYRCPDG